MPPAHGTYLSDLSTLSSLPEGLAPGDSFRRRKIPSRFFMSLALEGKASFSRWVRGRGGHPAPRGPTSSLVPRITHHPAPTTYSFMVCRRCRLPLCGLCTPSSISAWNSSGWGLERSRKKGMAAGRACAVAPGATGAARRSGFLTPALCRAPAWCGQRGSGRA